MKIIGRISSQPYLRSSQLSNPPWLSILKKISTPSGVKWSSDATRIQNFSRPKRKSLELWNIDDLVNKIQPPENSATSTKARKVVEGVMLCIQQFSYLIGSAASTVVAPSQ